MVESTEARSENHQFKSVGCTSYTEHRRLEGDYPFQFHYFSVLFLPFVFSLESASRIYSVLASFILLPHQ